MRELTLSPEFSAWGDNHFIRIKITKFWTSTGAGSLVEKVGGNFIRV